METNQIFTLNHLLYFTLGFLVFCLICYLFFYSKKQKRFHSLSLRIQIRNLLNISLLSAVGFAIIFLISQTTFLITIPFFRVSIEGVFVKINGFLFGPIIGIISAIIIESAILISIPSYFHPYYLMILISFGFFSGLIKFLISKNKSDQLYIFIIYIALMFFLAFTIFINVNKGDKNEIIDYFKNPFLIISIFAFLVLFIFTLYLHFVLLYPRKIIKLINKSTIKNLLPIFILAIFCEYIVAVCLGSGANQQVLGGNKTIEILFYSAILIAPFKIIFNTIIIYKVWINFATYLKKQYIF